MSIELVRIPRSLGRPALRVIVALTQAEREQVFALRYQIYVTELGLLPPDHAFVQGRTLRDERDERSILLLLLAGDVPAGTLRITAASAGPLELEQYRSLEGMDDARDEVAEATRFMVTRAVRRRVAGPALLLATYRAMKAARLRVLLAAGKVGHLSRYYQNVGLRRIGKDTFTYDLVGRARYELLRLDIGGRWSLTRARLAAFIGVAYVAVFHLGPAGGWILRRGFGTSTGVERSSM